ncbi:MAG TPA: hypothetical protein VEV83_14185 [Parafilimonas sp.]|mgnify:CR=1 FL=1|nr:hypothetical protein [Parafilimonas sp.]
MNTSIKTALAAIGLLVAFSCKKENSDRQLRMDDYDATDIVAGKYIAVRMGKQVVETVVASHRMLTRRPLTERISDLTAMIVTSS